MMGMNGTAGWWMCVLMAAGIAGFWLLAWLLVRDVTGDRPPRVAGDVESPGRPDPARLLDERLARGEVDVDDYLDRRGLLPDYSTSR